MKKPIKILNSLIALGLTATLILVPTSCAEERLDAPAGFQVSEDYLLTWDLVEDARIYTIEIVSVATGEAVQDTSRQESYPLASLSEGDYEIRIMATGGNQNSLTSDWSEVYSFHKGYETGCLYRLINNSSEYEIYNIGTASGTIVIEDEYRGKPVTQIADRALGSSRLEEVTIGNNVRSIGVSAFGNSTLLTTVYMPDSVTQLGESVFQGCSSLSSVRLSASLTEIPEAMFAYCTSLTEIELGDQITSVGALAFYGSGLTEIVLPDSVTTIAENAFSQSQVVNVEFGDGLNTIDDYAFYRCRELQSVNFGESGNMESIGGYAFSECTSLTSVSVPEGVTELGRGTFFKSTALAEVELPDSLVSVGAGSFSQTQIYHSQEPEGFIYVGNWLIDCTEEMKNTLTVITADTFREDTVGIADQALMNCPLLERVTLSDNIRRLGDYSFYSNSKLTAFLASQGRLETIGEYAFYNCGVLSNVQFGKTLTSIGSYAFYQCKMLNNNAFSNLLVPDSVTHIGTYAFNGTALWNQPDESGVVYAGNWVVGYNDLKSNIISLNENLVGVADYAFYGCETLENINGLNRAQYIGRGAFYGCSRLASVRFNRNLKSIEEYTFYKCYALFSLGDLPSRLSYVGRYAFYQCQSLNEVDFSGCEVSSIGSHAFFGCTNLQKLDLGDSLQKLDKYAFYGCSGLQSLTLPDSLETMGERAFAMCTLLTTLEIGTGLKEIGAYAFRSCSSLQEVRIPGTVETIGNYAFCESGVKKVVLENGVKNIGDYSFYKCVNLKEISFPESLVSIGDFAFRSCGLTSVVLYDGVTSVGAHAFYGCTKLTLYMESGSDAAAAWNVQWNSSFRPIVWESKLSSDGTYVVSVTAGPESVENAYALYGVSAPEREGYTFVGWALTPGATQADYGVREIADVASGTVLYTVWEKEPEIPEDQTPEEPSTEIPPVDPSEPME